MIGLIVVAVLALVLVFWVMGTYNGLVGSRNETKNAFSQIDVQLKRRYDLIPNLVETAKGYMKHEAGTLEAVIQARNQAFAAQKAVHGDPSSEPAAMKNLLGAESLLGGALNRLTVTMEQYPDLKANTNMSQLMEELSSTENKISFARQAYNDSVMGYNNKREMFPSSIIAGAFNFHAAAPYEIENPIERQNVKVAF
jgi:LemA protein